MGGHPASCPAQGCSAPRRMGSGQFQKWVFGLRMAGHICTLHLAEGNCEAEHKIGLKNPGMEIEGGAFVGLVARW